MGKAYGPTAPISSGASKISWRQAIVGLSRPRRSAANGGTFDGLALDDRLGVRGLSAQCGLMVIDIDTGATTEWLTFEHTIQELYDVAVLPGVRRPAAIGFQGTDRHRSLRIEA